MSIHAPIFQFQLSPLKQQSDIFIYTAETRKTEGKQGKGSNDGKSASQRTTRDSSEGASSSQASTSSQQPRPPALPKPVTFGTPSRNAQYRSGATGRSSPKSVHLSKNPEDLIFAQGNQKPGVATRVTRSMSEKDNENSQTQPPSVVHRRGARNTYNKHGSHAAADDIQQLIMRENTFLGWEFEKIQTAKDLARAGFSWMKTGDIVQCIFCGFECGGWVPAENPAQRHILSTGGECPFIKEHSKEMRKSTFKEWKYEYFLKSEKLVEAGFYWTGDRSRMKCLSCDATFQTFTGSDDENPVRLHLSSGLNCPFVKENQEDLRRSSFDGWPYNYVQEPEILVRAGFYWTGRDDNVKCLSCHVRCSDWKRCDHPIIKHVMCANTHCPFLQGINSEEIRRTTFEGSNFENSQLAEDFVQAGFCWIRDDLVKCLSCGLDLRDVDERSETPKRAHMKYATDCSFVKEFLAEDNKMDIDNPDDASSTTSPSTVDRSMDQQRSSRSVPFTIHRQTTDSSSLPQCRQVDASGRTNIVEDESSRIDKYSQLPEPSENFEKVYDHTRYTNSAEGNQLDPVDPMEVSRNDNQEDSSASDVLNRSQPQRPQSGLNDLDSLSTSAFEHLKETNKVIEQEKERFEKNYPRLASAITTSQKIGKALKKKHSEKTYDKHLEWADSTLPEQSANLNLVESYSSGRDFQPPSSASTSVKPMDTSQHDFNNDDENDAEFQQALEDSKKTYSIEHGLDDNIHSRQPTTTPANINSDRSVPHGDVGNKHQTLTSSSTGLGSEAKYEKDLELALEQSLDNGKDIQRLHPKNEIDAAKLTNDELSRVLKEKRAARLGDSTDLERQTKLKMFNQTKNEDIFLDTSQISSARREDRISKSEGPLDSASLSSKPGSKSSFYVDVTHNELNSRLHKENRLDVELPVAKGIFINDPVTYDIYKFPGIVRWIGRSPEKPKKFMAAVELKRDDDMRRAAGKCTHGDWKVGNSGYHVYHSAKPNIIICKLDELKRSSGVQSFEENRILREAVSKANGRPLPEIYYNGCQGHYYKEYHPAMLNPSDCSVEIGDFVKIGLEFGKLKWAGPVKVNGKDKWCGVMEVDDMEKSKLVLTDGIYIPGEDNTRLWLAVSNKPNLVGRSINAIKTLEDKPIGPRNKPISSSAAVGSTGRALSSSTAVTTQPTPVQNLGSDMQMLNVEIPVSCDILLNDSVMLREDRYDFQVPIYGIARWIGRLPSSDQHFVAVALTDQNEIYTRASECTYGSWRNYRLYQNSIKSIIVRPLRTVYRDTHSGSDTKAILRAYIKYANNRRMFSPEIFYNGGEGYYYKDINPATMPSIPASIDLETIVVVPSDRGSNDSKEGFGTLKWTGLLDNVDGDTWYGIVEMFEDDSRQVYTHKTPNIILTDGIYIYVSDQRIWLYISDRPSLVIRELDMLKEFGSSNVKPAEAVQPSEGVSIDGHVEPTFDPNIHIGINRGVQGDHNSCYMDATLYCMFSFSTAFDEILMRKRKDDDIAQFDQIQNIMRTKIVNPMRRNGITRAAGVHEFRELLDGLGKVRGLQSEEKDPEELINLLLRNVFDIPYYLELSNKQSCHTFHLLADADSAIKFPSIQKLVEYTCNQDKLRFVNTPPCLILQVPRFGKEFKMYEYIYPCDTLDVTDLLQRGASRTCHICDKPAEVECEDCFKETKELVKGTFCLSCSDQSVHKRPAKRNHNRKPIQNRLSSSSSYGGRSVLRLSAVLCIERSHYVSYVRTSLEDGKWLFLDSMSDRVDEKNIPEVKELPELDLSRDWYTTGGWQKGDKYKDVTKLHHLTRRLFKDVYACIYVNPETSQYSSWTKPM